MSELIFSFWSGTLNELAILSLKSWVKNGYQVHLYTDNFNWLDDHNTFPLAPYGQIVIKDYRTIVSKEEWEHFHLLVHKSDFFRFKYLRDIGGTWCDMDLVLLRKIPLKETIICSEFTLQKGGRKSLKPHKPSIFFLRFPKQDPLMIQICDKMLKAKYKEDTPYAQNLKMFAKIMDKNKEYKCVEPKQYAPINWSNVKEMFYNDKQLLPEKYGIKEPTWDEILEESIGIHFWNKFIGQKNIKLNQSCETSVYKYVKKLH